MNVARYLVQGVDVWLNNPRRPLEASGTSGMKVCRQRRPEPHRSSTAGGSKATTGDNGWAIGAGEEYTDLTYQDDVESRAIYDLLEQEIVPLFYTRGTDGLPRGWLRLMKRSMTHALPGLQHQPHGAGVHRDAATARRRSAIAMLTADEPAAGQGAGRSGGGGCAQDWPQVRSRAVEANGGRPAARRRPARGEGPRQPGQPVARRRRGAALPRRRRLARRDPAAADGADEPQRRPRRQHLALHGPHPLPRRAASTATPSACCPSTRTWPTPSSRGWCAGGSRIRERNSRSPKSHDFGYGMC